MGEDKNNRIRSGVDKFKTGFPDRVLKPTKKWIPNAEIASVSTRKRKKKSAGENEDSAGKKEDSTEQSCLVALFAANDKIIHVNLAILLISMKND